MPERYSAVDHAGVNASSSNVKSRGNGVVKLDQFLALKSAHERNRAILADDKWYAVSFAWWRKWEAISDHAGLSSHTVGELDNREIVDIQFGGVKPGACEVSSTYLDEVFAGEKSAEEPVVARAQDFVVVHESVWKLLQGWYGATHVLCACVHFYSGEMQYEFFPARFEVFYSALSGFRGGLKRVTMSKYQTMADLKDVLSKELQLKDYEFKYFLKETDKKEWKRAEYSFDMLIETLPEIGDDIWHLRIDKLDFSRKIPINNPFNRENPQVDQLLDVKRKDLKWCEGKIVHLLEVQGALKVVVHCLSFNSNDDEIHDVHSEALQPPYTRVEEWRSQLKVDSSIEARIRRNISGKERRQWIRARITGIFMPTENSSDRKSEDCALSGGENETQKTAYISIELDSPTSSLPRRAFKVSLHSESIAPAGTHIKDHFGPQDTLKSSTGGEGCKCLASVTPLVEYFLGKWPYNQSHSYKVNRSNPLGTGGKLAVTYGKLLKDIWRGKYEEIAPSKFKSEMGRTYAMFKGMEQHDAHEFFSLFVDRLHEDLNMIKEKPMTESVESDGREDAIVAKESWDGFQLRNASVVVDVFMGMIKSKLTCPTCSKEAIKFDPYSSLSLPIPTPQQPVLHVVVHRLGGKATRYLMDANKAKDGAEVAKCLAKSLKIEQRNILIAELSLNRLNKLYYVPDKVNAPLRKRKSREQELFAYELDPIEPDAELSPESRRNSTKSSTAFVEVHFKIPNENNKHLLFRATEILRMPVISTPQDVRNVVWQHVQWMFKKRLSQMYKPNELYGLYEIGGAPATFHLSARRNNVLILKMKPIGLQKLRSSIQKDPPRTYFNAKIEDRNRALNLGKIATVKISKAKQAALGIDVEECVAEFRHEETLGKNDTWYCSECKEHVRAQKKLDIWNTPDVLCIHLKRFQGSGRHRAKLNTLVNFPLNGLSLADHVLDDGSKPCVYDLFAVSNHVGSLNHGHYTAMVKRGEEWYRMNDRSAQKMKPEEVCTNAAYILFYRKR